ncbi:hypothetical protein CW751_07410 [Brumimicrobium salinarum]|uniref:Amidohydrolase 3 domain-containing protein n=1 Tax=Brumimicrobium salinarum TaxID=2058658 RepID=A0A2I0R343_9FLAO|nr:amidohydrolase family protein [Brumimicrobium salinarum]PKR80985.1 hypothetical protein CW751_07410 [Brumimicrobium salinarum]
MQFAKENGHFKVKNLSIRSFKIIADGALGSHGACMIQPYSDEPENYGMLLKTPSEIKAVFEEAKHYNYQVNSHCIGDSANRTVLRFIDTLLSSTPDHRWRIEHAQILHPEDFELLSQSGALPSVQPTHAVSDQRWAEDRIGKKRLNNGAYAYNSLQKSSGMVLFGTDFPIENYDPFATIHAAVERKNIENEPLKGFISDEAISFEKTLKAMTLWPAYGCFEEANVGSIEKGKTANLVIFDQPVKSHSNFLPNYSWITIINGEITFDMR